MKRFALAFCSSSLLALALSSASFAAPPAAPSGAAPLVQSGGDTAPPTASFPAFLAGAKLATTCDLTCTQARQQARADCRSDPSCTLGYFTCNEADPCASVYGCFCL